MKKHERVERDDKYNYICKMGFQNFKTFSINRYLQFTMVLLIFVFM